MVQQKIRGLVRINARKTDVFDIFNLKHYVGPNPYLDTGALVFDFDLIESTQPLPIEDYISNIGDRYPHLSQETYASHAHLFARVASEVGKLDMGLHLNRWSVKPYADYTRISIQSLHERTTRAVIYFVWDWFEAINQDKNFFFDDELLTLQKRFRQSVYGGPTVYALLRTAYEKGIPTFYLWSEALMQYGYGKKQVRGIATTFDCDSHLDSDFTTRKDECKIFMQTLGLPIPFGDIVFSEKEAFEVAKEIRYPVAVKPVVGHKGIGVTAGVKNSRELISAYTSALAAIPEDQPTRIIVEKSISGTDFRLLCVNGKFVAAIERRPASVTGDGYSTIAELIRAENRQPARLDTPTSPMSKIQCDEAMEIYLEEQGFSLDSVIKKGRTVYLRKVANLSAGGISIDATSTIHDDNIILAQDIAQHFRLTCLGVDVMAENLSESWKTNSNFAILEINAAPGILMHLNPAIGESVDVPSRILETFFESGVDSRIPIITFNKISVEELQATIDHILSEHPDWTIGAVCHDAVFINRSQKPLRNDYNSNVQTLLRNPKLDLLITEYEELILEEEGMFYQGSNIVVLNNPTETEMMLARDVFDDSTVVIKKENDISIRRRGLIEDYTLGENEPFSRVYLKEIGTI
ncbi:MULTISPECIES: cyanophycin synthetase [Cyanophyceae]|uniref:ATP-binding protein n=1 Tax=Cyanophyceae TaxID=3028117 RepID=UPI00232FD862|nr:MULTISPECIES: cyanophycin synthetase [Cyanophyceae]MDB9319844.1 cyanophycin synthetase [Nodularia spumigena CS-590/01A]MDB9322560.1 cyanophycin synthetase [Nodularia spumigena CS-591/07A]MDB9327410.1 cyanophycin synthetase [Nodularia spumigena CS-590/02]MDB9329914.1 cyanophycin synthetase [Nodularia spumigena CS-591/04]MDB9334736.1 cyanophycin synthetase [Nodularia spumigena CS-590/01]